MLAPCGVRGDADRPEFERAESCRSQRCARKLELGGDRLDRREIQDFLRAARPRSWRERICGLSGREARAKPSWGDSATARFIFRFWRMCAARTFSWCSPARDPVDRHLLELLLMIDAFKRASAWRVTAVVPYYAMRGRIARTSRACRFPRSWWPICWRRPGANRALTLDLHAPQIQGYFNVPVDHLYASPVLVEYFKQRKLRESDGGFAGRGRRGARARLCQETGCAAGHRG